MDQETVKCPYCGEEILTTAKKCKHCGEWLNQDENNDERAISNKQEKECTQEKEVVYVKVDDEPNFWGYLFAILIIATVAFFTLPSEEKQKERMMEELRVLVRKDIKKQTRNQDEFTQIVGQGMMKDKDIVDELVHQRYTIKVDNYKVFSSITVKDKETGETSTCGFAGFGIIYINK